ncbi:MAG: bifunctional phosphoribosylaminoimidazolecarboxamide formyltransferase/IMP cyclohydrolase [Bacteroidota bacterium]
MLKIRRALLSVSDKEGIVELASELHRLGVEIVSTGGTHALLSASNIPVKQVSEMTGFPEILDGRVKTLHPAVHAGLLAVLDNPVHRKQLDDLHIQPIDLAVVNLYPFKETIEKNGVTIDDAIEQIDIGGPAMIRSAAKNYRFTAVVVSPKKYPGLILELHERNGSVSEETCFTLAKEAFQHTAHYDAVVADYLQHKTGGEQFLPETFTLSLKKIFDLRYGENPHQQAALYGEFEHCFKKLHGKEMSYNNIIDTTAAVNLLSEFVEPTAVIIKHTNPCGAGKGSTIAEAYQRAIATDPKSAFGGIVAVNRPLDMAAAELINQIFTEIIIAPSFPPNVLEYLMKKKERRLVQQTGDIRSVVELDIRKVTCGLLVQSPDKVRIAPEDLRTVTERKPTADEVEAMIFAWKIAKHVKSNAIVYAVKDNTIGIGAGQMSRVDSSKLAVRKAQDAGLSLVNTVVASDAYFPFADGLIEAVKAGATAVIQPGGSVRDNEVIKAANDNNIAMVFTGVRHFRH